MKQWLIGVLLLTLGAAGVGVAACALESPIPPEESVLSLFPQDTAAILFVNLGELSSDPLVTELIRRQSGVGALPFLEEFSQATGFDVRTDVQHLAFGSSDGAKVLVAARASYDPDRVASYFSENDVATDWYGDKALYRPDPSESWKVSFVDGWILIAEDASLRDAIDRMGDPVGSAMENPMLVSGIESIEEGSQLWAAGAFNPGLIPEGVAPPMATELIAALERGTYQMRFGEVVSGRAVGEFSTPEAAERTLNLLQGLMVLGRIQASEHQELLALLDSIHIEALDSAVRLSFAIDQTLLHQINESGLQIR